MATTDPTDPQAQNLPLGVTPEMAAWVKQQRQAPPPTPPSGISPEVRAYMNQRLQLPPDLDQEGLRQAQQADVQRMSLQGLGQGGERAAAMIQGRAPNFTGLEPDQLYEKQFAARRGLEGENLGRAEKIGMLPVEASVKTGQAAASQAQAGFTGQETQTEKARTGGAWADTKLKGVEAQAAADLSNGNSKRSRDLVQQLAQLAPTKVVPGMSGADVLKVMPDLAHQGEMLSQNPRELAPGAVYYGPKRYPTPAETEPFMNAYTPAVQNLKNLDQYDSLWSAAEKNKKLYLDPAWRQSVTTLGESIFPGVARTNSNGTAPPLADLHAAQNALATPDAADKVLGWAGPKVHASVKMLSNIIKRDTQHVSRTHFVVTPWEVDHAKSQLKQGERLLVGQDGKLRAAGADEPTPSGFSEVH